MPARTTGHRSHPSDPLAVVLQPPPGESPTELTARLAKEQEDKRVSDAIDDELRKERNDRKKRGKREVKVLLLGQSESGKSTVLKNFRLKYAPVQWKAELRSWRTVIQLNLVQNVLTLLDVIQERLAIVPNASDSTASLTLATSPPSSYTPSPSPLPHANPRGSLDSTISDITFLSSSASAAASRVALTQKHRVLLLRLSPLRKVAEDLRNRLGVGAGVDFSNGEDDVTFGGGHGVLDGHDQDHVGAKRKAEFAVRGWISALGLPNGSRKSVDDNTPDSPTDSTSEILFSLRDDILALWEDMDVRALLRATGVRIEDRAGFFLPDTTRITALSYVPSDNDVVRARLRTMGVQEWRVVLEPAAGGVGGPGLASDSFGSEWVIYDVGGSRSLRHAWLPYFDAVNAIIFLAPISCFDERLTEDPSVNRLEDTLLLWKAIVGSKLLGKITLIVFLNKCDLLKRKLQSGIMVNKYMISFGNRENEVGTVVKYLKDKFKDILRADASEPRTTYLYATSVTDTKATATTLNIVRDGIIREHLKHAEFV